MRKILIMILAAGLLLTTACGKKPSGRADLMLLKKAIIEQSGDVEKQYGMKLKEGVICRDIKNRSPVHPSDSFNTGSSFDAYFFTHISTATAPATVTHRFSELVTGLDRDFWVERYSKQIAIETTNYITWTYKTVYPGVWRADLLGPDGMMIMKSIVFEVDGPAQKPLVVPEDRSMRDAGTAIEEFEICANVQDRKPVNPGRSFTLDAGQQTKKVWVWARTTSVKVPSKIYLRWSGKKKSLTGEEEWVPEFVMSLDIKAAEWRTFAWRDCAEGITRLDIFGPDGSTIMKTVDITVRR